MTPPPVALCWAGLCPTGVLGEGVPLPRLLKIDFTCPRDRTECLSIPNTAQQQLGVIPVNVASCQHS